MAPRGGADPTMMRYEQSNLIVRRCGAYLARKVMMPRTGSYGRHADGHAIAWHHLDAEAPHPAAQLREDLVARVALNPIQPA